MTFRKPDLQTKYSNCAQSNKIDTKKSTKINFFTHFFLPIEYSIFKGKKCPQFKSNKATHMFFFQLFKTQMFFSIHVFGNIGKNFYVILKGGKRERERKS